jgi:heme exporter protein C
MLKVGETSAQILGLAWWKLISIVLIFVSLTAGIILDVPELPILHETIRNLYYHVTQWFGMMIILTVSLVYSIIHLAKGDRRSDIIASESINVALLMGVLGLLTGMLWAKFTWGTYWTGDAKLNGVAMGMLVYLAYTVLRGSMDEEQKRGRVSAVYNIFAYVMFMVFIMVLPRMTDSLHPGNGGNPGFGGYDLNSNMRMIFYPSIIGWTLLGVWLINLRVRMKSIEENRLSSGNQ